jgi:hypothetical protein
MNGPQTPETKIDCNVSTDKAANFDPIGVSEEAKRQKIGRPAFEVVTRF